MADAICQRCGERKNHWNVHTCKVSMHGLGDWQLQICEVCEVTVVRAIRAVLSLTQEPAQ